MTRESPMPSSFLMTDPGDYDVRYRINPWMDPTAWSADPAARRAAAHKGSGALCAALEAAGARVERIAGVGGLPGLVVSANAAIPLVGRLLLARFLHPERRVEEAVF